MNSIPNTSAAANLVAENLVANNLAGDQLTQRLEGFSSFEDQLKQLDESSLEEFENVGKQFESVFVSLMLKEMRNTLDSDAGGLFSGDQSDTFGGMFDQFMGEHLSSGEPLGIAKAITSYLKNQQSAAQPAVAPGAGADNAITPRSA